jgi:DNA-binding MarR family transcriptional regulator
MGNKKEARTIESALIQIVRSLGRYNLGRTTERILDGMVNLSHLAVIDCLDDGTDNPQATIGSIGRRVGVDPSRASRMVRSTVRAGYVERVISQEDARKTHVILTAKGKKFAAAVKIVRRRHFANLLKGWSKADCDEFGRLLTQFAKAGADQKSEAKVRKGAAGKLDLGKNVILHPILRLQKRA